MYAKIIEQNIVKYPYTEEDLRADNRNVSFAVVMSDESRADFNMIRVVVTGSPEADHTKNVVEGMPVYVSERSRWEQTWIVTDATTEQIAERTTNKATEVRSERNKKLADSDWTQVADAPVDKTVWAAYRQQLRDISSQSGFPWEITWPQEP